MESMAKLLQAQTQMLAAQAQAVTAQGFPPLKRFSGENTSTDDDSFERWLEQLEERARIASWSADQQLYQLKMHLEGTALQVFRMLPDEERSTYNSAVQKLKKRFRPIDIEELKGIEFHQKIQADESIEQLGIDLQTLGRKAFPQACGREFDCLLKGPFFQALRTKWQRKLGAPKPGETFYELYDRARTLERHEQQYNATAAARDTKSPTTDRPLRPRQPKPPKDTLLTTGGNQEVRVRKGFESQQGQYQRIGPGTSHLNSSRECFRCHRVGHVAKDCPRTVFQQEVPGRASNPSARTAALTASPSLSELTEKQLEELLTERRLEREGELLRQTSTAGGIQVDAVTAEDSLSNAVGPTLLLALQVEGVKVSALVDTGSQSTIISRQLLHEIGKHLHSKGKPLPELEKPSARLYGKDGRKGNKELNVTAQLKLTLSSDGKSVVVPVFVQPDSEQPCLLGMNAAPALGLKFLRSNGQPLQTQPEKLNSTTTAAAVYLIQSSTVPGRKGRFLEAHVGSDFKEGDELLFEPNTLVLKDVGLSCQESLLTVGDSGRVLIPLQNFRRIQVDLDGGLELGYGELLLEDEVPPENTPSTPDSAQSTTSVSVQSTPSDPVQSTPSAHVLAVSESHSPESCWLRLKEQLNLPSQLTVASMSL